MRRRKGSLCVSRSRIFARGRNSIVLLVYIRGFSPTSRQMSIPQSSWNGRTRDGAAAMSTKFYLPSPRATSFAVELFMSPQPPLRYLTHVLNEHSFYDTLSLHVPETKMWYLFTGTSRIHNKKIWGGRGRERVRKGEATKYSGWPSTNRWLQGHAIIDTERVRDERRSDWNETKNETRHDAFG
ncbi:hypothetical protein BD626DRAFT_211728 [Schizophyllum amplum]|uniref:Uncharacterized protein n=1 Tax=Schizophyllum amplum TaxID=97359 RepID=A0A550BY83_9AGAR|nr:hypothetical protein BD626DRAFT_211728 [Auriculariopsis ampla]